MEKSTLSHFLKAVAAVQGATRKRRCFGLLPWQSLFLVIMLFIMKFAIDSTETMVYNRFTDKGVLTCTVG